MCHFNQTVETYIKLHKELTHWLCVEYCKLCNFNAELRYFNLPIYVYSTEYINCSVWHFKQTVKTYFVRHIKLVHQLFYPKVKNYKLTQLTNSGLWALTFWSSDARVTLEMSFIWTNLFQADFSGLFSKLMTYDNSNNYIQGYIEFELPDWKILLVS